MMDAKPFELDAVDVRPRAQEGAEMELLDPAGNPTGVILLVRGTDSEAYRSKMREQVQRQINRNGRKPTSEQRDQEFWELHATLIAGWKGRALMQGGKPLEYSADNAARFLEQYDWAFEQVRRFADKRENFLPGPPTP
jgi:hypothetical protein